MVLTDSLVHMIGLVVAVFLAFVGIVNALASRDVSLICQKIDGKIDTHIAVDQHIHGEMERRIGRVEDKVR